MIYTRYYVPLTVRVGAAKHVRWVVEHCINIAVNVMCETSGRLAVLRRFMAHNGQVLSDGLWRPLEFTMKNGFFVFKAEGRENILKNL